MPRSRVARARRGRARAVRRIRRAAVVCVAGLVLALLAVGVGFAGSAGRIADGVTVAGVGVGGMTAAEARQKLRSRAARYASEPVVFTAGEERWSLRPADVELRVDWTAAAEDALARGDGPLPLRGLQRLKIRLFGAEVEPHSDAYEAGLDYHVSRIAKAIDAPAREASVVLSGLSPSIVPARPGLRLDRESAKREIVAALAAFERRNVPLPVEVDEPEVTRADLVPIAADVRRALSAPVRLTYKDALVRVRPADLAPLLELPAGGSRALAIDRREARRFFANIARGVRRTPVNADFAVAADGTVSVVRSRTGRVLNVALTSDALLAAALRRDGRTARLVVDSVRPKLTTAAARALGLERRLAAYSTLYSGTSDRIQNLQRAVTLLDGALLRPGATFSFNERIGPRTEERGFRPAPVILDGEYKDGIGGGVSQVATTLFNAAWEAGLKITSRTAHALYISRYPVGRDATVNYPDIDLRFSNDTGRRLLIDATYDESGILISLLGGGTPRRVVSETGLLKETAPPRIERKPDPTLYVGERVIEDMGEPARAVRVTRTVYVGDRVLYEESWYTSYRSEPRIVRVGTKPKPVAPPPPPPPEEKKAEPSPTPGGGNDSGSGSGSGSGSDSG